MTHIVVVSLETPATDVLLYTPPTMPIRFVSADFIAHKFIKSYPNHSPSTSQFTQNEPFQIAICMIHNNSRHALPLRQACAFSAKLLASMRLMIAAATKKRRSAHLFVVTLPTLKSRPPTAKLSMPQSTFTMGDDNPLPGGSEKGVGNAFPEIP